MFEAFAEGGKVTMPLQKTFWVESFGMVTDRFGTPWMVNGGKMIEHVIRRPCGREWKRPDWSP